MQPSFSTSLNGSVVQSPGSASTTSMCAMISIGFRLAVPAAGQRAIRAAVLSSPGET